ncbi:hypothetical protein BGZ96_011641 [Linnemannia gamsii]|uniref:Uncharacterized protein n=1 Tax=Linnemannia gamsii TaxID=64522 RepID=A0ABQ7JSM3_9FUNG|nr:hypothetical protein BGZ96_011641 [Linnemannia gamsii]
MHKLIALLAFFVASAVAQGDYHMDIYNNVNQRMRFYEYNGHRSCICVKNVQSAKIRNVNVGDAKLFSTIDCTGNYDTVAKGATQANTQWSSLLPGLVTVTISKYPFMSCGS